MVPESACLPIPSELTLMSAGFGVHQGWFSFTVFFARLLPLARTFVSLPAGHFRVALWRFVPLTVAGCAIWSVSFVVAGALTGAAWHAVATTVGRVLLAIAALTVAAFLLASAHEPRSRG